LQRDILTVTNREERHRQISDTGRVVGSSSSPILLRLAPHRLACRILHLEPIRRAAGVIERVLLLRHDALEAKLASVVEHGLAVCPLNGMPTAALARTDASVAVACPEWLVNAKPVRRPAFSYVQQ
jgi:hypothetical protein